MTSQQTCGWWNSKQTFELSALLRESHEKQAGGRDFEAACDECYQELLSVCSAALSKPEFRVAPFDWTPDVRLEVFGSKRQGTALMTSDLDVRMSFEQFSVHGQDRQLRYLRAIASEPGKRFEVLKTIASRLPLLRLQFDGWLEVDLTMGESAEEGPWIDTSVVSLLSASIDDGAIQFVRMVKAFSKHHCLVDAYNGLLNSTSWACIAMSFLQGEGCLPPLKVLERCPKAALWPVRITAMIFVRFFTFIERCSHKPHRISLRYGYAHSARHRSWSGLVPPPLFVEHPEKEGLNLAACLTPEGWRRTVARCVWARDLLLPTQGPTDLIKAISSIFGGDESLKRRQMKDQASRNCKRARIDATS